MCLLASPPTQGEHLRAYSTETASTFAGRLATQEKVAPPWRWTLNILSLLARPFVLEAEVERREIGPVRTGCMSAAWQASHKEGMGSGVSRAQDRPLLWEGSPWSRRHWWSVQHWRNAELSPKPTWGGSVWAEQGPNLHRGRAFRSSWRMSRRWPCEEIQGGHGSQAFKLEATGRECRPQASWMLAQDQG